MLLLTSPIFIKAPIAGYRIKFNHAPFNIVSIQIECSYIRAFDNINRIKKLFIIEDHKHIAEFKVDNNTGLPLLNLGKITTTGDYIEANIYFESMYYITNNNKINEIILKTI